MINRVTIIESIFNAIKRLSLFIVPSLCACCKVFLESRDVFCADCAWKIFPIVSKTIDITSNFSVTVYALTDYKDPLKKLILAKKWSDTLASYQLGSLICDMLPLSAFDCDMIVPIPLHWTRYASRGFNQAQIIAQTIKKRKNIPIVHVLKRVKKTKFQFELASSMRSKNVKDAFELTIVDKDMYKDKHILLVDDLMTTGSTIQEAARVLLLLKPKKITVVVACRVL